MRDEMREQDWTAEEAERLAEALEKAEASYLDAGRMVGLGDVGVRLGTLPGLAATLNKGTTARLRELIAKL